MPSVASVSGRQRVENWLFAYTAGEQEHTRKRQAKALLHQHTWIFYPTIFCVAKSFFALKGGRKKKNGSSNKNHENKSRTADLIWIPKWQRNAMCAARQAIVTNFVAVSSERRACHLLRSRIRNLWAQNESLDKIFSERCLCWFSSNIVARFILCSLA